MGDPKLALAAKEKEIERMIKQDEKELDRVAKQRDAEGKPFASSIKALQDNIDRHVKQRDEIVSQLNDITKEEYARAKSGKTGGGQSR